MEKEVKKPAEDKETESKTEKPAAENLVTETKSSNNKVLVIVLVVVGALVIIGLLGTLLFARIFNKTGEKLVENITTTKNTLDEKSEKTSDSKSSSSTESAEQKLPSDFPSEVLLYSKQKITSSYKSKNTNGNYWQIVAEITDSVETTVKNFKSLYSKWELVSETEYDGSQNLSYKSAKYTVNLAISSDDYKTTAVYTVEEVMPE